MFRKDKWGLGEKMGNRKVCDNICLSRYKWSVFFTAMKSPWVKDPW